MPGAVMEYNVVQPDFTTFNLDSFQEKRDSEEKHKQNLA